MPCSPKARPTKLRFRCHRSPVQARLLYERLFGHDAYGTARYQGPLAAQRVVGTLGVCSATVRSWSGESSKQQGDGKQEMFGTAGAKRNWTRWLVYVGGGLMVMFLTAAGCGSSSKSSSSSNTTTAPTTAQPAPTTAAPTTEAPTTAAPAPTAPPTTVSPFDKKYGSFAPTAHSGTSDSVVPIPTGAKAGLVTATYAGTANFSIEGLDAENQTTADLLVNTVGAYSGTTAFGFGLSTTPPVNLKVTATGAWTLKIAPISTAPTLASPATGKGDAVYLWKGKATTWTITNAGGEGNFIVDKNGSGGLFAIPNLVNEIGAYHGSVPVAKGPAVTTIQSDGTWTITFS